MKSVYIFRHGQTEFNKKGVLQGRAIDAPLNDLGREQAAAFFSRYQTIPFDRVISSELQRSIQSVQAFIDMGVNHQIDERITEFSWGKNEGKPLSDIVVNHYKMMLEEWYTGNLNARIPGGESGLELQNRVREFIQYIKNLNYKNLLICTHGRTLKMLIVEMLGMQASNMENIRHSNTALFQFNYGEGRFDLLKENDISHLPETLNEDSFWDR